VAGSTAGKKLFKKVIFGGNFKDYLKKQVFLPKGYRLK
jgi:hypothetical protein